MYGSPEELQTVAKQSEAGRNAFTQKYGSGPQQPDQPQSSSVIPTAQAAEPAPISDPDLAAAAKESAATRSTFTKNYGASQVVDKHDDSDKKSMVGSLMLGGHMGMMELAARAVQGGAKLGEITGYMPKGTAKEFTRQFNKKYLHDPEFLSAKRQHPYATGTGEIAGSTTPLLAIPFEKAGQAAVKGAEAAAPLISKAAPAVARGLSKLAPTVGKGLTGAAIAASQYDPSGKETKQQMELGAAANTILPAVGGKVVGALGKGVRELAPAVTAAAKKFGTTLSPFPSAEKWMAKVPFSGVGKVISARGKQLAQKGKDIAASIINEAGGKPSIGENGEEKGYAKYFTDTLLRGYRASKASVSGLKDYLMKKSDDITHETGKMVTPINMRMAASNAKVEHMELPAGHQDKAFLKEMTKHENTTPMTFRGADALKKQLDDKISAMGTPATGVQKNLRRVYSTMRKGIANDINDFATEAGPQFKAVHEAANQLYAQKVAPFDKAPYSKLITGDMNSGKFISKFIKPTKEVTGGEAPEDINKLLSLMHPGNNRAKVAIRAAMTSRALEAAELPGGGINGKKFADEAIKISKGAGGIYSKEQKALLKGYQVLTHHLEKFQPKVTDMEKIQATSMPKKLLGMGGLGLAFWHPWITGAIYSSAFGMSKLFTTGAGQKILRGVAKYSATASKDQLNSYAHKGLRLIIASQAAKLGRG